MKEALAHFDMPWLPISAMILFLLCFMAYAYWTFKKENKSFYEHASQIPLEEEVNERRN